MNFPCRVFPVLEPGYRLSEGNPAKRSYSVKYGATHLEFEDYTVKIFKILRSGVVHRDEFFSLQFGPMQPVFPDNGTTGHINMVSTVLGTPVWTSQKAVETNFTMTNRFNQVMLGSLVFEFDRADANVDVNGANLKFSYRAHSTTSATVSAPN